MINKLNMCSIHNRDDLLRKLSKNPKLIAATAPDIMKFVHQGKGFHLGKIH